MDTVPGDIFRNTRESTIFAKSFFTVNFPVNGIPFGIVLSNMFGWTGVYVAAILVVILFLGMGGLNLGDITGGSKFILGLLLVLIAILVLGYAGFPLIHLSDMAWTFIFVAILIGGAVVFLGSDSSGAPGDTPDKK